MNIRFLLLAAALAVGVSSALAQVTPKPTPKPPVPVPTTKPAPAPATKPAEPKVEFEISRTIKIGGEGRWEFLTLDPMGKFLYVARNQRMQVVDLTENKLKGEIMTRNARGVTLVPSVNRGFITAGADNQVIVFDIPTLDILGRINVEGHPAASAYEPASKKVLVCGIEGKCVTPIPAAIDLKTGKPDKAIDVSGRPTSIVTDSEGGAFASIMDSDEIVLIDAKAGTLLNRWPLGMVARPSGLAIDEPHARIFVALRQGRLGIYSMADGHEIQTVDLRAGQVESTAFCNGRVFVLSVDGTLIILSQSRDGRYEIQQSIKIGEGSTTMAVDPKTNNVYIPAVDLENRRPIKDSFKIVVVSPKQ